MEYITSRGYKLSSEISEIENHNWYNLWKNKQFPYNELLPGDTLFWYDTSSKKLVWKTQVIKVDRFPYSNKQEIKDRHPITIGEKYFEEGPSKGHFIGYKVKVLEKIEIQKPSGYTIPQIGWIRVDNEIAELWFNRKILEETNLLDDLIAIENKSINEILLEINKEMQHVLPTKIPKLVDTTIRKDTKIVNLLKEVADYKCQFPNCGHRIIKKKGGFYIEVAHIKPVKKGGQSILGNLLVLCPNHHKEFDYGNLVVKEQITTRITGILNNIPFDIGITNQDESNTNR